MCSQNIFSQDLNAKLPSLLINEVNITNASIDDIYIELVVIKSNDIPNNVNDQKPKIIIDDSNVGSDFKSGFLAIKPECVKDVKPGDIIIIHGIKTDVSNVNKDVLLFEINDKCIEKWDGVPNQQNSSYNGGILNNNDDLTISDFISFNSSKNKIQTRINEVYFNKVDQKGTNNYSLHSGDLNDYTVLPKTLGVGNNAANQLMIEQLYSQSHLRINCELISSNAISIEIDSRNFDVNTDSDYSGPYTLKTDNYEEFGIEVNAATAYGLECGLNIITITDQLGRTAQCEVSIELENAITVQTCGTTEVDIQSLICDNIESDCIYFKPGNNEAVTLADVSEIPKVTPEYDDYPVILKFSDRDGNIVYEIEITIDIINPGDTCDDTDECTENDKYDDTCNCIGKSKVPEIELVVDNEIPCMNSKVTFSVEDIYDEYSWRIDGKRFGGEPTFETVSTGLVEVRVTKDGCSLYEEYLIPDLSGETVEITSSSDVYCNSMSKVVLSIDPLLAEEAVWTDEFGVPIATDDPSKVTITHEGIYFVKIFDCDRKGSIVIRGANNEDYKISPHDLILCYGSQKTITLEPSPPVGYDIAWSTGETMVDNISVNGGGTYGVTVTSTTQCEYVDKIEVLVRNEGLSNKDLEEIASLMAGQGFGLLEFDLEGSSLKSETSDSRSSCDVMNPAGIDYILLPNITGSPLSLEQVLNDIVKEGCKNCAYEAMGYLQQYECTEVGFDMDAFVGFDMDAFLALGNEDDGYVKVLTVEDEARGKLQVFYINTIKASANSLIALNEKPEIVKDVVFDLICGLKNEESLMNLDYLLPNGMTSIVASNIEFLPPVFLSDPSNGLFETVKIANLLNGRAIILPDPSDINPTQLTEIPLNPKLIPLIEYESINGDIWMYKFLYEECDPTTTEYLYIYIEDNVKDNFHNILTALTSTDDEEQEDPFFDINDAIAEEIYLNGNYEVLESIPPCLLGDDILCQLIYETIYPPEIEDGNPSSDDVRALALAELIKTNSKDVAIKVKKCLLDEVENDPLLIDNIQEVFGYNDPLFEAMTHLFYTLELEKTFNTKETAKSKEYLDLYAGYGSTLFTGEFNGLDVRVDYAYNNFVDVLKFSNRYFPNLTGELIHPYEIHDNFNYYQPYGTIIDNPNFNLPTSGGFKLSSFGIIPGVFVPYAVEKTSKKINRQTLITSAFAIGAIVAAADVAFLYGVGELATLEGAFAGTDLTVAILDLLTSIEPICEGLDSSHDDWCKKWKAISFEASLFSVTGRVTSGHYAKMRVLEEEWFIQSTNGVRQALDTKHGHKLLRGGSTTVTKALDDFFISVKKDLRFELEVKYGGAVNSIPSSILDDIDLKFPNDGFFLLNEELATAIKATSNNGADLFEDLIKT
ncbi:MAG: hypothetical protein ACI86M_000517, partial [Saprospiraceae bacterium]